ncbi:hypothetical protein [Cutibacterium namnetense]|uniref:Uncharacterized protein n=1 Tax=[Propionibacterium] namnetense SK182B-JCVI TaxID=1051006 RepID=F9NWZ2_9ACTN|nr:hypothetical protein [Cutibacterium namnetense]EGR95579.1 hypothetical protein HMPREF1162_1965 [ [[Propionibacterium] namnetense SK182B-JCVI]TKW70906.1 MAG: hypothetical protein DI580_10255 [Cutibacterium acnes]
MKNPKVYLTSLIITIIATLALATGTILILILMFSVHDNESAHPTGLFGSVYFQSAVEHSHNTVKATMGVASLPRLGAVAVVIFVFILLVSFIAVKLKTYRESLLH